MSVWLIVRHSFFVWVQCELCVSLGLLVFRHHLLRSCWTTDTTTAVEFQFGKVDFAWSERFWQSAGISSWHQQNFTGLWKYESKFPNSKSLLKIQMMTKVLLLWLDTGFLKKSDSLFTYQISFSTRASAWQFFALLPPQRREFRNNPLKWIS